jgi:Domain of unknown function (DUF4132)
LASGLWDRIKTSFGAIVPASGGARPASFSGEGGRFPARKVADYFKVLAKERRTLPAQIAKFVDDGSETSLILTLQSNALRNVWRTLGNRFYSQVGDVPIKNLKDWRIDQMMRFGEVSAALEPITHDWGFFGTKKSPDWLRHAVTVWLSKDRKGQPIVTLRDLANHGGVGMAGVIDIVFCRDAANYGSGNSVGRFAGVPELLTAEREAIIATFGDANADVRAELVAAIGRFGIQADYLPMLLDAAIGTSKKVRGAARKALTGSDPAALATLIETRFAKAAPGQRAELVDAAAMALGDKAQPLLARLCEGETSAKVLAVFGRSASAIAAAVPVSETTPIRPDGPEGYTAADGSWVELPPLAPLPKATPLDRSVFRVLDPAASEFNALLARGRKDAGKDKWHWSKQYAPVDRQIFENLAKLAEGKYKIGTNQTAVKWLSYNNFQHPAIDQFFDDPRLSLFHIVRLAVAMSNCNFFSVLNGWSGPVGPAILRRIDNGADVRTVIALWVENGGQDFIQEHLNRRWYWSVPDLGIDLGSVIPSYFPQIDEALGIVPQSGDAAMHATASMDLLAYLPKLPNRYRARLMRLANESSRRIRDYARDLLQTAPDIGDAIAQQLDDGQQGVRAMAADWLAKRGERGQSEAIRTALKKEKSDVARAAMISALERMGEDVSAYFDHATMIREAQAGVTKLKTKALDWFPFDRIPALTWADGTAVDPVLPRWWIMLACKLKQPGGNALMDLWLERLAPGDAHRLGWMVLSGWIDEDVRSPTDEEANAYANANVDATVRQHLDYSRRWPQMAEYYPTDRAVVFARLKAAKAAIYLGSAVDSKGVLALTTHVNGADAAQRVRAFLKDHGARVSQAKALLDALGGNGSPPALQVVLAAANRSKQKSVQAHAAALIEDIADRNGWTPAQLADRTVPTGGFDGDGTLDLDCGQGRLYSVRLDAQDAIVILNADGREVKTLPGPRVDEERPTVEAAKKLLSNARKEVKQVFSSQAARLQEAMCLQRGWPIEDWQSFVVGHPIVGRIACRLVWHGIDDQGAAVSQFRPLGDGSHSDANDGDVDISGLAEIRLAHSSLLGADAVAAWRTHLADYDVTPPFDQFGRDLPQLTEALAAARAINDREGWMIETFQLRGMATKLGYQRGQAQDGGWFMTYEKTFREAGLMVEIEFTGSPLPEENRVAALQSLCFCKIRGSGGGAQVALSDVPPVLLAECWQDFYDIAAKGTGFDPDWRSKVHG